MERPLSELLKLWRAERPDEWTMDEFICEAEKMEKQLQNTAPDSDYAKCHFCNDTKILCSGAGACDHDGSGCSAEDNCGEYKPTVCHRCNTVTKK